MPSKSLVDPSSVSPADPFVSSHLAASLLPSVIGRIVARDNITTDDISAISAVIDRSGSLNIEELIAALVGGYQNMVKALAVTHDRAKMHLQTVCFDTHVEELHTFTRLVSPTDNRTLNVPLLISPAQAAQYRRKSQPIPDDRRLYDPGMGGLTATVAAMMKVTADLMYLERVLGLPDIDVSSRRIAVLLTDGFGNVGSAKETAEYRRTVKRLRAQETWTFLAFCLATNDTVETFAEGLRNSRVHWTGTLEQARQLMYEAMMTGWGYYVDDPAKIKSIGDGESRDLAELYLASEEVIIAELEPRYVIIGGMGFPRRNVLAESAEPETLAELLGTKVSSSIVRASQGQVPITVDPASVPAPSKPMTGIPDPSASSSVL